MPLAFEIVNGGWVIWEHQIYIYFTQSCFPARLIRNRSVFNFFVNVFLYTFFSGRQHLISMKSNLSDKLYIAYHYNTTNCLRLTGKLVIK